MQHIGLRGCRRRLGYGTYIVGGYPDGRGVQHGFLYNIAKQTWTDLDDPLGVNGTDAQGIDGANVVGVYFDNKGVQHGFPYNITNQTWTMVDDPLAGSASGQGTSVAQGNIAAGASLTGGGSPAGGGAIWNEGSLLATECTFAGNSAVGGAGITPPHDEGQTAAGGSGTGGAIYSRTGGLSLTNCTLALNSGSGEAGSPARAGGSDSSSNAGSQEVNRSR